MQAVQGSSQPEPMVPCLQTVAAMHGREQIGCAPLPPVDPPLAPLVAPSGSLLCRAAYPNRDVRVMDSLLAKLHWAMATQACLSNFMAILWNLVRQLPVPSLVCGRREAATWLWRWTFGLCPCLAPPLSAFELLLQAVFPSRIACVCGLCCQHRTGEHSSLKNT